MTERAKRIRDLMAREERLAWYSDEWVLLNWYKLGLEIREYRKDPNYRKDTIKYNRARRIAYRMGLWF